MKKLFPFISALLSMFAVVQMSAAADLVFNVTVPTPTYECWVVGNFNDWNNNQYKMTKVDDTHYTITIPEAELNQANITRDGGVKYKYLSGGGDWAYVEKDANGNEISDRVYTDGNDVVQKWALVYNPNVEPIPMTVTIIAQVPADVVELYIVGTFNSWTIPTDSTKMTLLETNESGKVFSATFFTADANKLQFKFCAGPAWDYEQTQGSNYTYPDPTQNTAAVICDSFKKIYVTTVPNVFFDRYQVKTVNKTITVNNVTSGVELFDVMGRQIEKANVRGTYTTKALTNGIYILKVDGITAKIAVK